MRCHHLLLVSVVIMLTFCCTGATETHAIEHRAARWRFLELVGRRIREWFFTSNAARTIENLRPRLQHTLERWFRSNHFVERCFGVARRLKFAMPLIMIKLGVIVTILGFLTIFALKSLGLLITLFIFNTSALATKLAMWKNTMGLPFRQVPPQNVHFHIHPGKEGPFLAAPTAAPDLLLYDHPFDKAVEPSLLDDPSLIEKLALLQKYQQLGLYQADGLDDLSIIKQR